MGSEILEKLEELISERKENPREGSYTCSLFSKGKNEILKKLGEEAVEVIVAAYGEGKDRVIYESADLLYHLIVLLVEENLELREVFKELENRFGRPGGR